MTYFVKKTCEEGLEGQRAISAAKMSEEPDNDIVPDEFLREEIGCCLEQTNRNNLSLISCIIR